MYLLDMEKARHVLATQNLKPYQIDQLLKRFPPLPDSVAEGMEGWFGVVKTL